MMASDDGCNAWGSIRQPPSHSAFGGPLPRGRLRRFPRIKMVDLVLTRIASSMKEDWLGAHLWLLPSLPWKSWGGKLAPFERVLSWPASTLLFVDTSRMWRFRMDRPRCS